MKLLNRLNKLRANKEEGFTLIELLVVIVIIGVLAAIALPIFMNQQVAAQTATIKSDLRNAGLKLETYYTQNQMKYPANSADLSALKLDLTNKSFYLNTSGQNNMLVCISNTPGNPGYFLAAKNINNEAWGYSSKGGLKNLGTMGGSYTSLCPDNGVDISNSQAWGGWGYNTGAWATWFN
jgi:type IV pilus assembly protein PilA